MCVCLSVDQLKIFNVMEPINIVTIEPIGLGVNNTLRI